MKRAPVYFALALVLGFVSPPASAQTRPAAPSADDAAMAAQKAAFLALPEATRKAVQEALVWLGLYNGVNDGDFGKRTRDAILAFQTSIKAPADGALPAPALQALLAAAQKARDAAGFQVVSDPKTGVKIGAPLKLLSARGGARLDFASDADTDLAALYARLSAATPTRKITYKAIKPDAFLVVSGQDGAFKFYTRFDKNPTANPPIRGFTFTYPASQTAYLDRIAIAVANSFEPFPGAAAAPAASAGRQRRRAFRIRASASPPSRSLAGRNCLRHRARQGADRAQDERLPKSDRRREAGADRARRRGDRSGDSCRRLRRERRTAALWRAGAGSRRPGVCRAAPCGKLGLVHGRRNAAGRDRRRGQERRRRTGVRSKRGAGRARGADGG